MKNNLMILGLTLLVAMVACEISNDDQPSNLRLDITAFIKEAKNAVKQQKIRSRLRQSRRHRQKIEEALARADEAAMAAMSKKDHEAAKEARVIALEMRDASAEAKKMIKNLIKMERRTARRQRADSAKISDEGSLDDPTDPEAEKERKAVEVPKSQSNLAQESAIKGELTDPDESGSDIRKLVKQTHENMEKKPNHEIIISKGMTKDEVKMNGEVAKKLVKESEVKKANGEEIIDKQANLEIDRAPNSVDSSATQMLHEISSFFAMAALTFVLVF